MDGLKILFFFIRADTRDQFSMDVIVKKKSKLNIKVRKKKTRHKLYFPTKINTHIFCVKEANL